MPGYNDDGTIDLSAVSPIEYEEHAHIGGVRTGPAFKNSYAPPVSYKAFPSLASGFTFHCLAPVGSASGASLWRVFREDKASGTITWSAGNANWVNTLNDVTALSYS